MHIKKEMPVRKIIVNADDFGKSSHTVEWTIRGFENGTLTSATIMAGMPYTQRAVEYALMHEEYSFGVHLYFTDLQPMSRGPTTMVDPRTGCLWSVRQFALRSGLGMIRLEDVKREIVAQFMAIKNCGLDVSHVDGHGHMHRMPLPMRALKELKGELGIKRVRKCQDVYYKRSLLLPQLLNRVMDVTILANFKTTDHFAMTSGKIKECDSNWFDKMLRNLPDGVTEIGLHPGVDKLWRRLDTEGPFAQKEWYGITRISYKDI